MTTFDSQVAVVRGEPLSELPTDLYIPPDALRVFLDAFEGPLDLLLYLIRKQNFDILDIPVAEITKQYIQYIEWMKEMKLELAAEYLVMAAMLAEIKSRLLLPRPPSEEIGEEDPRAELVRRLQEYEKMKEAAAKLDELPQQGRDIFWAAVRLLEKPVEEAFPKIELDELAKVFQEVLKRAALNAHHAITKEPLSIRERMTEILMRIQETPRAEFASLFSAKEGRLGVVVTFIAILELLKQSLIEMIQEGPFSKIEVVSIA